MRFLLHQREWVTVPSLFIHSQTGMGELKPETRSHACPTPHFLSLAAFRMAQELKPRLAPATASLGELTERAQSQVATWDT